MRAVEIGAFTNFGDLALRTFQYLVYLFSAEFSLSLYFFRTCFLFVFRFDLFWFFFQQ